MLKKFLEEHEETAKNRSMVTIYNSHFYRNDETGHYIPSVTTILNKTLAKQSLVQWYKEVGVQSDVIAQAKADIGSRVHDAIDKAIKNEALLVLNDDKNPNYTYSELNALSEQNYVHIIHDASEFAQVLRALNFLKTLPILSIEPETHHFHLEKNYAGTIDIVLEISEDCDIQVGRTKVHFSAGDVVVLDWKTGVVTLEAPLQIAAYSKMYEASTGKKVTHGLVVYTNAKTKNKLSIKHLDESELNEKYDTFLDVKKVYDKLFAIKEPSDILIETKYKFML